MLDIIKNRWVRGLLLASLALVTIACAGGQGAISSGTPAREATVDASAPSDGAVRFPDGTPTTAPPDATPRDATVALPTATARRLEHFKGSCLEFDYPAGWLVDHPGGRGSEPATIWNFRPTGSVGYIPPGTIKIEVNAGPPHARGRNPGLTQYTFVRRVPVIVLGGSQDLDVYDENLGTPHYGGGVTAVSGNVQLDVGINATSVDDVVQAASLLPGIHVCTSLPAP
jgi:hypothetical protein